MLRSDITFNKTSIDCNESKTGETIEQKVERIIGNKEPITDGAPIIHMERKDGIIPDYDIRTDRFEKALEATDIITKTKLGKRAEMQKPKEEANKPKTQGTEPPQGAA